MDNQYNYYRQIQMKIEEQTISRDSEQDRQQNPKAPKPKKGTQRKSHLLQVLQYYSGAVGGVTMQGTSYLTGKLLGKNTKSTVGTTKTVSNAKLTTSTSTVTSDVSDIVENTLPSIVSITNMSVQEYRIFSEESASRRVKAPDPVSSSARMIQNSWLLPITMLQKEAIHLLLHLMMVTAWKRRLKEQTPQGILQSQLFRLIRFQTIQ